MCHTHTPACLIQCVEVLGQLQGVSSLFPPSGFQGQNQVLPATTELTSLTHALNKCKEFFAFFYSSKRLRRTHSRRSALFRGQKGAPKASLKQSDTNQSQMAGGRCVCFGGADERDLSKTEKQPVHFQTLTT